MPKSKRNRFVSLTATKRKPFGETKQTLIKDLRDCCDEYSRIFVFRVDNMRNTKLKDLRQEMRFSRFFFGKNKVMQIGLGRTDAEEYKDGVHNISDCLHGQCGLLFTNQTKDEVFKFFKSYREKDYARTGDTATGTVQLTAGPLKQFPHNIEPYLRQLGMPTSLQKGVVTLLKDFEVCQKGQQLTSEQARILKLLEMKQAEFCVKIQAMWQNDGTFEEFEQIKKKSASQGSEGDENDDDDDEEYSMDDDDGDDGE